MPHLLSNFTNLITLLNLNTRIILTDKLPDFSKLSRPKTNPYTTYKRAQDIEDSNYSTSQKSQHQKSHAYIKPLNLRSNSKFHPHEIRETIIDDNNSNDPCKKNMSLSDLQALKNNLKKKMNSISEDAANNALQMKALEDLRDKSQMQQIEAEIQYTDNLIDSLTHGKPQMPNIKVKEVTYVPQMSPHSNSFMHHNYVMNNNMQSIKDHADKLLEQDQLGNNIHYVPADEYAQETGDPNLIKDFENLSGNQKIAVPVLPKSDTKGTGSGGENHNLADGNRISSAVGDERAGAGGMHPHVDFLIG